MQKVAANFCRILRFPRVIGATDCTLVKISSPGGEDSEIYWSTKTFFADNSKLYRNHPQKLEV